MKEGSFNPIFHTKFEGVGHTFKHCTCEVVCDGRLVHILLNVLYDNYESFFQILGGQNELPFLKVSYQGNSCKWNREKGKKNKTSKNEVLMF
jgi:hypothetical protein